MLEDVAAVEVTVLIEMIMERGVDGGKFLQGLHVPELRHLDLLRKSGEHLLKQEVFYGTRNQVYDGV